MPGTTLCWRDLSASDSLQHNVAAGQCSGSPLRLCSPAREGGRRSLEQRGRSRFGPFRATALLMRRWDDRPTASQKAGAGEKVSGAARFGRQRAAGMKTMKPPGVRGHRIVGSPSDHRLEDLLQASPAASPHPGLLLRRFWCFAPARRIAVARLLGATVSKPVRAGSPITLLGRCPVRHFAPPSGPRKVSRPGTRRRRRFLWLSVRPRNRNGEQEGIPGGTCLYKESRGNPGS